MNATARKIPFLSRWLAFAVMALVVWLMPLRPLWASNQIENTGDVLRTLIPAIAYGATIYLDDSDGRKQFYKSFFSNLAVTYALKKSIDKTRPNGKGESFPSGHSSVAFQGAGFIHQRYGVKYAVPAYIGATFVAWSRVESDNHFTVDVVAGAAIGIAGAMIFTTQYKGFVVTPVAGEGFYGIGISRQW